MVVANSLQIVAGTKHVGNVGGVGAPVGILSSADSFEAATIIKHLHCTCKACNVETRDVEILEERTVTEHIIKCSYIGGVEISKVYIRQRTTLIEHLAHIGYTGGCTARQVE